MDLNWCQITFPFAPMVQPWCNLGRNNGHNRHNGQLNPHICDQVDIIDTIDTMDKEVHNFESVGWGFESLRVPNKFPFLWGVFMSIILFFQSELVLLRIPITKTPNYSRSISTKGRNGGICFCPRVFGARLYQSERTWYFFSDHCHRGPSTFRSFNMQKIIRQP